MLSTVISGTTIGIKGILVKVEVDVYKRGFPQFRVVGLPGKSIEESKDRVKTAIKNSGFRFPEGRIVVNLAPADIPKDSTVFDLPIAIGILTSSGVIHPESLKSTLFFGELSLNGNIRAVIGSLSIVIASIQKKITTCFIPTDNLEEVSLLENCNIYAPRTLAEVVDHLNNRSKLTQAPAIKLRHIQNVATDDFSLIRGQLAAKRAVEIAAAGGHNLHLIGPPGSGKTMIAKASAGILPKMSRQEIVEIAQVYSVRRDEGDLPKKIERPFRNPHHTISSVGMVGGGGIRVLPGEISLAHLGVLFLDEFPEFPRSIIEALRQPLEDGVIIITRSSGTVSFPARFMLICASNPCPCGYLGHPKKNCVCTASEIMKYRKKLSGPIVDRIDLHVFCHAVDTNEIIKLKESESSDKVRQRVETARERQRLRFRGTSIRSNSEMNQKDISKYIEIDPISRNHLKIAIDCYNLSARGYFRILKVARTIADLSSSDQVEPSHILEAIQFRVMDTEN